MSNISTNINEISTSLLKEFSQEALAELRDLPYNVLYTQSKAGFGVYIRNTYLSSNSIFRKENCEDICNGIIENLWCKLQIQKI